MKSKFIISTIVALSFTVLACGGSSSTTETIEPPTAATNVTMTVGSKALNFSWSSGNNVDHYRISVNPDGVSGFSVKSSAANIANSETSFNLDIPVHKTNWLSAQYVVEACNADESSCVSSPNQTHVLADSVAATIYVKASNTGLNDNFGYFTVLSGDGLTLAVSAKLEDSASRSINGNEADNSLSNSGAVYVYAKNGTVWSQQAYLKASNADAADFFGNLSLSADGNTLAVGATAEASNATGINGNQVDNTALEAGAVYVFTRTNATWSQQAYLKASNTGTIDGFGFAVSLSGDGNTLAVTSPYEKSAAIGIDGNQADNTSLGAGAALSNMK